MTKFEYVDTPYNGSSGSGSFLGHFVRTSPEYGRQAYDVWIEDVPKNLQKEYGITKKFIIIDCVNNERFVRPYITEIENLTSWNLVIAIQERLLTHDYNTKI